MDALYGQEVVREPRWVFLYTFLVAACGALQPGPSALPLPTDPYHSTACGGIGGGGFMILMGAPSDPHLTWEVGPDGGRQDIVWPPGYRARFDPSLEVLNPAGAVVFRQGDQIAAGGCVAGGPSNPGAVILIQP